MRNGSADQFFDQVNRAFAGIDRQQHPVSSEKICLTFLQIFLAGLGFSIVPERHSALEIEAPKVRWVFEIKFLRPGESAEALLAKAVAQFDAKPYDAASLTPLIRVAAVFSEEKQQFVRWQQVS